MVAQFLDSMKAASEDAEGELLLSTFESLCSHMSTRKRLIECNVYDLIFHSLLESSRRANVWLQARLLSCLKPFFSSPRHQRKLIKANLLDRLVRLISSRTNERVLLVVFDTIRYVDRMFASSFGA